MELPAVADVHCQVSNTLEGGERGQGQVSPAGEGAGIRIQKRGAGADDAERDAWGDVVATAVGIRAVDPVEGGVLVDVDKTLVDDACLDGAQGHAGHRDTAVNHT